MFLRREKTRSDAAALGVNAKTMRAASAHVGKRDLSAHAHHLSTLAVNSLTSEWSTVKPWSAAR